MLTARDEIKEIKEIPSDERCVSLVEYDGDLYLATEHHIFIKTGGGFRELEVKYKEKEE